VCLPIADDVLELEITPNRPDCLGLYGVAREAHAATGAPLAPPPWAEDPGSPGPVDPALATVSVETPQCLRFTARVFEGVTIGPSPAWLKARLLAAGQRSINNVVDITNYVMLLTGQPLHAFDLDRVAGGRLTVRQARAGETLTTLDGVERALDPDVVLIEDDDGPTSLAGVMGGLRSEVEAATTRVLLEVATWDGPNVNRTMARFGLRSEAGARYEKGLAPEQTLEAQAVATRLMLELTGASLAPGTIDEATAPGAPAPVIRLRDARVERLLGAPVARAESRRVLEALGFGVTDADDGLDVAVPHFRRNDVTREADVVEEVARLSALDALPSTLPENRTLAAARLTPAQRGRRRAEDALVGLGLSEVAGWSFTDVATLEKLRVGAMAHVALRNPMSEKQAILRPTIVGSLLDVAAHNVAHGTGELAIFESAPVYRVGGTTSRTAWPTSITRSPRSCTGRRHPATGARPRRPRRTSSRSRGCSSTCSAPCAFPRPTRRPRTPGRSCTPAGAPPCASATRWRLRRRGAPRGRGRLGPAAHRRDLRGRPRQGPRCRARGHDLRRPHVVPGAPARSRGRPRRGGARRPGARGRARRGRQPPGRRRRVRRLRRRAARRGPALARAAPGVPGPRPDAHRR
jgi:phenylalanyl-tRNA synthetase beta chain